MASRNKQIFVLVILAAFLFAACSPAAPAAVTAMPEDNMAVIQDTGMQDDAMPAEQAAAKGSGEHTGDAMMDDSEGGMTDAAGEDTMAAEAGMMEAPAWFSLPLTNVRSGESFTLQDLKGKVILVETMAQWCSNCLRQQKEVLALHGLLGERDDFVSLGLDIDPNEDAETLKEYTERNGFTWRYAVSPVDVSRDISQLYGDQFLNPPSTPMLIIDRSGQAHPLPFGIKSADDLQNALQPYLEEGM